jgi:hypothetical protein
MRRILGVIFDESQPIGSDNNKRLLPFSILWMNVYAKVWYCANLQFYSIAVTYFYWTANNFWTFAIINNS